MINRNDLIAVFDDTEKWSQQEPTLVRAIDNSIRKTHLYMENEYPKISLGHRYGKTSISVKGGKTFETAMRLSKEYPDTKIAVHNFASATNPGGGVRNGSRAQEECLCRCSTLYPVLDTKELWESFYRFHRARHDTLYTDACIYIPDILIIKTDEPLPRRMPKSEWCKVDILTCAAPNLRQSHYAGTNYNLGTKSAISARTLKEIHVRRARHMLTIAAANEVQVLVLGAFGCGAFQNSPTVVAAAYKEVLQEFDGCFRHIEFAVYCPPQDKRNYEAFYRAFRQ